MGGTYTHKAAPWGAQAFNVYLNAIFDGADPNS